VTCPHADIRDCPIYHAAHVANAGGCDDGRLLEGGGCAVSRGMNYEHALGRLRVTHPKLVADCEWNAALRARQSQRDRNMRSAGVH
jgi:hypothetical protein